MLGTALLIFTLSMDEIAVTFFLIGRENTLPLEIWSRLRRGATPEMNAIATLIFLFSVITIFLSQWLMTRGEDGDQIQSMSWTDKELGMDRRITRRDFMNGAAMAIAAAMTPHSSLLQGSHGGHKTVPAMTRRRRMDCAAAMWVRLRWLTGCATALSGPAPGSLKAPAKAMT